MYCCGWDRQQNVFCTVLLCRERKTQIWRGPQEQSLGGDIIWGIIGIISPLSSVPGICVILPFNMHRKFPIHFCRICTHMFEVLLSLKIIQYTASICLCSQKVFLASALISLCAFIIFLLC